MNYNKDIMDWAEFPKYDWLWCDPPWGEGLVKMFQTMMLKQTGETVNNTLFDIINHLGELADTTKPLIVEYSVKDYRRVVDILSAQGHECVSVFARQQTQSKRPFVILVFNSDIQLTHSRGMNIIYDAAMEYKPKVVFDPFAGIGATAKEFRKAGVEYIGSEVNTARFNRLQKVNQ